MASDNPNLGADFSCVTDLDRDMSVVDGRLGHAQAIARRCSTSPGGLFYDRNYGYNVVDLANSTAPDTTRTASAVEGQAYQDQRTQRAQARCEYDATTETFSTRLRLRDEEGPFDLTLTLQDLELAVFVDS